MREMKFRAWDNYSKEWCPNLISLTKAGRVVVMNADGYADPAFKLMQFTGLRDNSGHEIYEGDIVNHFKTPNGDEITDAHGNHIYEIIWAGSGLTLQGRDGHPVTFLLDKEWGDCLQVIGNIYEHPDLIG